MNSIPAPYIIELLTPRVDQADKREALLDSFATRYERVALSGCGVSVPDNPMGQLRLHILDCLKRRQLKVDPRRFVMNLNTFHTKSDLDTILQQAASLGIKNILVVRGDGGSDLPRLDPKSIGGKHNIATSIDLLRYISEAFPNTFKLGAAFNPYNRRDFELRKTEQKIENGASYIITQPITGRDESVDELLKRGAEVIVEVWMSDNIELLYKSVGKEVENKTFEYDPYSCVKTLHHEYPESCIYLAMLKFKEEWERLLPRINI